MLPAHWTAKIRGWGGETHAHVSSCSASTREGVQTKTQHTRTMTLRQDQSEICKTGCTTRFRQAPGRAHEICLVFAFLSLAFSLSRVVSPGVPAQTLGACVFSRASKSERFDAPVHFAARRRRLPCAAIAACFAARAAPSGVATMRFVTSPRTFAACSGACQKSSGTMVMRLFLSRSV